MPTDFALSLDVDKIKIGQEEEKQEAEAEKGRRNSGGKRPDTPTPLRGRDVELLSVTSTLATTQNAHGSLRRTAPSKTSSGSGSSNYHLRDGNSYDPKSHMDFLASIEQFLKPKRPLDWADTYFVTSSWTLRDIIDKLVAVKGHRLWVVDDEKHPVPKAVLTVTSVVRILCAF